MRLGRPPAPGCAQRVISRFTIRTLGWITSCPGGVDMRSRGGGINRQVPAEFSLHIGLRLQMRFNLGPNAGALPGLEQRVDPPPRATAGRYIPPGQPIRMRCRTPLIRSRNRWRHGQPWRLGAGSSGLSTFHWALVRSWRVSAFRVDARNSCGSENSWYFLRYTGVPLCCVTATRTQRRLS